ncbi:MAG: O-antigen ligase family protein [Hoeflea sp.]|nr:O-antigen ligase family protein [Hoeflea sp.]
MHYLQPSTLSAKKILLMRRRLDGLFFFLAAFFLPLPTEASAILLAIFLCMGLYVVVFKPRRALSHLDTKFLLVTLMFSASSVAINLANGSIPEDFRWSSYPLYYSFVIPIIFGAVLVRDPLRQFVLGTRAALLVLAVWGLAEVAAGSLRPGFGANPANAAFSITFIAVVSRLNVSSAPMLLSNRYVFFYLGLIAVLITQTRALLPVFAAGLAIDIFGLLRNKVSGRMPVNRRSIGVAVALASCLAITSVIYPIYADRIGSTFGEIRHAVQNSDSAATNGLSIRFAQWRAAVNLITENPLIGRGGAGVSEEIVRHKPEGFSGDLTQFTFVHNFILDETIQRGLLGLAILAGYFGFCLFRIYRFGDATMKENVLLILVLTFSFGLLHYLLVKDRHVILYALYFLLLTTANHGWRAPYNPKITG